MWTSIVVGEVAKRAAVTWLHEACEYDELLAKSISEWPENTFYLAVHVQEAINATDEILNRYTPTQEEEDRMAE